MQADLPQRLPLICPACRRLRERGRELWTVPLAAVLVQGDDAEVLEGSLRCENTACARFYPILDGIPILVADPAALLRAQPAALTALRPETLALLVSDSPDDAPLSQLAAHL